MYQNRNSRGLVLIDYRWIPYDAIGTSEESYKQFNNVVFIGSSCMYEDQNGQTHVMDEPMYFFEIRMI